MTKVLVSIIIPNYNHAKYLHERMESILAQTSNDFEVIILDDCSTDSSKDVIESYRENPKVSRICYNDNNCGRPFLQWEKGIALARGRYVWIAESDDCCSWDLLSRLLEPLEEDEGCVLSFCRSLLIDSSGNPIGFHSLQMNMNEDFIADGRQFIRDYMVTANCIVNASAVVFRKDALKGINDDFRNYRYCGDTIFWSELAKKGRVAYCSEPLNSYRRHSSSQIEIGLSASNRAASVREEHSVARYFLNHHFVSPFTYIESIASRFWASRYRSAREYEYSILVNEYPCILYRILAWMIQTKKVIFEKKKMKPNASSQSSTGNHLGR